MPERIQSTHHYAEPVPMEPAWRVYERRTGEQVAEWLFVDEDDVRRRLERLDKDVRPPSLFD